MTLQQVHRTCRAPVVDSYDPNQHVSAAEIDYCTAAYPGMGHSSSACVLDALCTTRIQEMLVRRHLHMSDAVKEEEELVCDKLRGASGGERW